MFRNKSIFWILGERGITTHTYKSFFLQRALWWSKVHTQLSIYRAHGMLVQQYTLWTNFLISPNCQVQVLTNFACYNNIRVVHNTCITVSLNFLLIPSECSHCRTSDCLWSLLLQEQSLTVFYMALLCVTLVSGIVLCILDSVSGNKLNLSARARRKAEKHKKEEEEENVTTIPRYKGQDF